MPETSIRRTLYVFTVDSWLTAIALAFLSDLKIAYLNIAIAASVALVPLGLGVVYARRRGIGSLVAIFDCLLCGLLAIVPIGISTYLAMQQNLPLADPFLDRADRALGFDWHGFIAFVDQRPFLATLLGMAYQSFQFQLVGLPILSVLLGERIRAYRMVMYYALVCYVSSVIAIWFPAFGTYASYGVKQDALLNINVEFGYAFLTQFNGVRDDPAFVFSLKQMMGILTFPSVHAGIAVLCIWMAWPLKGFRHIFILLNLLMMVSAISHAGHYLADILAGIAVASGTIAFASLLSDMTTGPET